MSYSTDRQSAKYTDSEALGDKDDKASFEFPGHWLSSHQSHIYEQDLTSGPQMQLRKES